VAKRSLFGWVVGRLLHFIVHPLQLQQLPFLHLTPVLESFVVLQQHRLVGRDVFAETSLAFGLFG
jgi:hypothetical protein